MLCYYVYSSFFSEYYCYHRDLHVLTHSYPTRRSSDLIMTRTANSRPARCAGPYRLQAPDHPGAPQGALLTSTRGTPRAILITSSFRGCPPSLDRNLRKGSSSMFRIVVAPLLARSEEHTSELQSLIRSSYAVFCLIKKK